MSNQLNNDTFAVDVADAIRKYCNLTVLDPTNSTVTLIEETQNNIFTLFEKRSEQTSVNKYSMLFPVALKFEEARDSLPYVTIFGEAVCGQPPIKLVKHYSERTQRVGQRNASSSVQPVSYRTRTRHNASHNDEEEVEEEKAGNESGERGSEGASGQGGSQQPSLEQYSRSKHVSALFPQVVLAGLTPFFAEHSKEWEALAKEARSAWTRQHGVGMNTHTHTHPHTSDTTSLKNAQLIAATARNCPQFRVKENTVCWAPFFKRFMDEMQRKSIDAQHHLAIVYACLPSPVQQTTRSWKDKVNQDGGTWNIATLDELASHHYDGNVAVFEMWSRLWDVHRKRNESMEQFAQRFERAERELVAVGEKLKCKIEPIPDQHKFFHLYTLLENQQKFLEDHPDSDSWSLTALISWEKRQRLVKSAANRGAQDNTMHYMRSGNRTKQRSGRNARNGKHEEKKCFHCNQKGHTVKQCWLNENGRHFDKVYATKHKKDFDASKKRASDYLNGIIKNKDGSTYSCMTCGGKGHWPKDCPQNKSKSN